MSNYCVVRVPDSNTMETPAFANANSLKNEEQNTPVYMYITHNLHFAVSNCQPSMNYHIVVTNVFKMLSTQPAKTLCN